MSSPADFGYPIWRPFAFLITKLDFKSFDYEHTGWKKSLKIPGVIRIRKLKKDRQHYGQKKKGQRDKQRSTKHTHKTKDRVTRTPLKFGDKLMCSGRISSSCSTSGTRHVNLLSNPVISHEWGKVREVLTTRGTCPWSFVKHVHSGQPSHVGDRKIFEVVQ